MFNRDCIICKGVFDSRYVDEGPCCSAKCANIYKATTTAGPFDPEGLSIVIVGGFNTGKTTIAEAIEHFLLDHGIPVDLHDTDARTVGHAAERMAAVGDKLRRASKSIQLSTVQIRRAP